MSIQRIRGKTERLTPLTEQTRLLEMSKTEKKKFRGKYGFYLALAKLAGRINFNSTFIKDDLTLDSFNQEIIEEIWVLVEDMGADLRKMLKVLEKAKTYLDNKGEWSK